MANYEISVAEKSFINGVIGPQLQNHQTITLNQEMLSINYCIIGKSRVPKNIIVLLAGFGSGWTGIAKLGYELTKLEWQVCMISMPGYGNSGNPFPSYYAPDGFTREANVLAEFAEKVLLNRNIHWVGHSMGSAIITELACLQPRLISSLVLLNPAGFEKRGHMEVAMKFLLNGMMHGIEFNSNPIWEELKKYLPKEKSPFSFDRIAQRFHEWDRICNNSAMASFLAMYPGIPFRYITSEKDFVFPYAQSALVANWMKGGRSCFINLLPDLWHNTTMFGSEITAKAISDSIAGLQNS